MICEVCGKEVPRLKKVIIEGAIMNVCDECAKLGIPVEEKKVTNIHKYVKEPKIEKTRKDDLLDENEILVDDYGERLKRARESKNLTLEEAAKKLLEKKNVLSKLEKGEMRPDKNLIKKLEKFYGIKLTEKITISVTESKSKKENLTLGDLIKKEKD
ncbi:MAG: multiprotein bridging factor aMBF1 [Thermoplasmata archaeon]